MELGHSNPRQGPSMKTKALNGATSRGRIELSGLFVYDRMAEAPPSILDDPVRALVDLSTAQQAEVYRHLEEYNGQSLWNQAPACERLAARTIRSVYRTMLRNVCVLRRVYGAYRRFAPMPHSDPYVLSCAQFWCLAFDADLLSPSSSLYDTAKLLLSSGSDKNFQRARRLSGGTPATLTVIEKERRRSSQSIDFRLTDLAAGAQGSPRTAIPTPAPQPATLWEAQDEAQATTAYAASTLKADQQQDPENHFPEGAAAPGMAMSTPETPKQTLGRSHKARSSAYAAIAEDSLRLHRRPVLFTAFLRALVLLLQIRLRSLRRENRNNSARGSEASSPGAVFEGLDLDDPNCLSLAWIALCRKLRIFSDTLERQIQNEFRGASHNNKDPQKEYENQATGKSTQQADSGGSGSSSFSRQSSEQSHLKEGVPPQPPLRREGSLSQQLKGSPSGQGRMKPSINRQPSGTASTSTRKTPDAARWVTATGGAADDSRPQDISQSQGGSREESFVLAGEVDEIAACAGRHVEVFRQAAFAEKSCILDDALHKALFSSSRQQPDSSGIQGAMVCSVRVLFRLLDIAGLVLSSDNQQVDRGAADARGGFPAGSPRSSTGSGTAPRSRRSSLGGSILLPRLSASRGRLSRSRPSKAVEWPTNAGEATSILRATPLRTFALPTLLLVAVMLEVLPASVDLKQNHQHNNHQLKNPFRQQGRAHDQPKLQEVDFVEFATCSLGDTAAARREEIQRQQQQQMMILDQQQHTLREAIRKGLLSWSEIANWNLTFIEVQRLFLRIVQLKMPPAIAALLTLEKQVEEFLRLLSTAALPSLGSTQPLPNASLLQADTQEQAQICQQPYLSGNDSPAARSDATFSAALTGDGERSRCFWHGFCGTTIKGRPIYDMPLKIDDSVSLEVQDSEDAAGSDTSDSSN